MASPVLYNFFTSCNSYENEAQLCGRRVVLEGDEQPLRRQELDSNVLKSPLLDGHIIQVSKLVPTR